MTSGRGRAGDDHPGEDGLPGPVEFPYVNTYADTRWVVGELARLRLGPSIAIFEPGFLRTTLAYHRAGKLPPGAFVKLYFGGDHAYLGGPPVGATFGLPPTPTALAASATGLSPTCTGSFRCSASAGPSWPARCPAASSRCARSAGRSWRGPTS